MDFATQDVLRLTHDREFQRRIDTDKELDRLMSERDAEPAMVEAELFMFLGAAPSVGKLPLGRPTAADISWLWVIKSPYIVGGKPTPAHVDAALWILASVDHGSVGSAAEIIDKSAGFCMANGVDYPAADNVIAKLIKLAFMAADFLPDPENDDRGSADFDCEWLTRMAATAKGSGLVPERTFNELIRDVPLVELNYMCVQARRARGENIGKRHKTEKVFDRIKEMMRKRLNELDGRTD